MKAENKLVRRFFLIILLIVVVMFIAVYLFSVPLIQKEVFAIERNSARLALNNIFQLANKMSSNLEGYREQALEAHRKQLKAASELTESQIRNWISEAKTKKKGASRTREQLFQDLHNLKYGTDGYVWIADHDATLLSYPDFPSQEAEFLQPGHQTQSEIVHYMVDRAIKNGESYYQYKSQRYNGKGNVDKISYVKDFPQWGLVIGSELYLDDLNAEVEARRVAAFDEVREALGKIRVAKTGYLFIFDKFGNMLAHPNPNIDNTNALALINPKSGRPILSDLISVSDTGTELYYQWDKPSDPNNYIYDKIALVRSLEKFGWYIGSSVYIDELRSSAIILSQRILIVAFVSILISLVVAIFFINRIFRPIKQLVRTAEKINSGDMSAKSGISSDDEIGMLANAFDKMVNRLRINIEALDSKVKARTKELGELEERQRLILDALPAQVAYINKDLFYVFVNKGYADIFGDKKHVIVGKKLHDVVGKKMMEGILDEVNRCLAGEKVVYEYSFNHNGREVITKRILLPDFGENGDVLGILNLSLDITAEKEVERRLTEAHRIGAAGQLAGGLAHDFNNLLSIILGNLEVVKERYQASEGLDKYIDPAIRASLRGAEITERLLTFSRHQALSPVLVDPQLLIEDAVQLVQSSIPKNIDVYYDIETNKAIFVDVGQMENVLVNLVLNAKDVMPKGGDITFVVRDLEVGDDLIYDEGVPAGHYVEMIIRDTGCGFSEEARAKACEPFFTTKPHGKGTGLGLSMVYGFIKQSNGYLSIDSFPGNGASISLLLPSHQPEVRLAQESKGNELTTTSKTEKQLFLLVDDNEDVREIIREQLVSVGNVVMEASNADEAAQLIDALPHLDGLVTDISMPGKLDGFELAGLMKKKFIHSNIVLITGYIYGQEELDEQAQWCIIRKPFNKDTLMEAINQSAAVMPKEMRI